VGTNGAALMQAALTVNIAEARANLVRRFEAVGVDASVPDVAAQLTQFADQAPFEAGPPAVNAGGSGGSAGASSAGKAGEGADLPGGGGAGGVSAGGASAAGASAGGASAAGSGGKGGGPGIDEPCTLDTCPCVEVWSGDFDVAGPQSLPALECVREITGSLRFHQNCGIPSVALPELRSIGADLYFHESGIETVSLPALASVGAAVYFHQNAALTSVGLPSLATVGEYLYFDHNCALTHVGLDALQTVGPAASSENAYLYFSGNLALPALNLPALSSVASYVYVSSNCSLAQLALPNLTTVSGEYVYVHGNAALGAPPVTALDARLVEIGFSGERQLAAGGACNAAESCAEVRTCPAGL